MSQTLFRQLTKHQEFCCPWAFIKTWTGQSGKIAKWLGVSQATVGFWKRRYKRREISCEQCDGCRLVPTSRPRR